MCATLVIRGKSETMAEAQSFGAIIQSHRNNFNLVRLILAILVVFYHAFALNTQGAKPDPLTEFLLRFANIDAGRIAVDLFFVISGVFVTQSWLRNPDVFYFFIRRFARIVPAVFVCATLTTAVAVVFFSRQGWHGMFEWGPWQYIFQNSLFHGLKKETPSGEWEIPGIYYSLDVQAPNGSLWTLVWEGRFYVFVALTGAAALVPSRQWFAGVAVFFLTVLQLQPELVAGFFWEPELSTFFMSGVLIQCVAPRMRIELRHIGCALGYFLLFYKSAGFFAVALCFGVFFMWVGSLQKELIPQIQRHDYSLGVYIYHWPLMQMLRMELSPIGPFELFFTTMVLVLPLAALSWHYVEMPSMEFAKTPTSVSEAIKLFRTRAGAPFSAWRRIPWKRRRDEATILGTAPVSDE
jgi:peptidoglycan/LPS O-acetylase OafA/YrhL